MAKKSKSSHLRSWKPAKEVPNYYYLMIKIVADLFFFTSKLMVAGLLGVIHLAYISM